MKRYSDALREAARFGIPQQSKDHFRALADELDAVPLHALFRALLVKHATRQGQALVGSGTLRWAAKHVDVRIDRDGDALVIHWDAPPLKPEGV